MTKYLQPARTAEEGEQRRAYALERLIAAQKHRRDRVGASTEPHLGLLDYSAAGQFITLAMQHLDEALPSGQKERAEAALDALLIGAQAMAVWMNARGYVVPDVVLVIGDPAAVKESPAPIDPRIPGGSSRD